MEKEKKLKLVYARSDDSKPILQHSINKTKYEEIREFTYNKYRYYHKGNGVCTKMSVEGHNIIDLDGFYYHGLRMDIEDFSYRMYTENALSGAIVSEDNKFFSKSDELLFDKEKETIISCFDFVEIAVVPSSVKKVKKYAFANNDNLKKIVFKGFIEQIDESAFSYCKNLKEIVFENGVYTFDLYNVYECSMLTYIRCNQNEKSKITGTIYMKKIKKENQCSYIQVEDNPYYFFFEGEVDEYPEDIYDWPDDEKYDYPSDEDLEKYLVLKAEDQEIKRAIINNKVVAISGNLMEYDKMFEIKYDTGEKLYFSRYVNDKRIYDEQLLKALFSDDHSGYIMLKNRIKNKHLLGGLSAETEEKLIDAIHNLITDRKVEATIKYKWYDQIIKMCKTGVLSLNQATMLYAHYERKKIKDLSIQKALYDYIIKWKNLLRTIIELPAKSIRISNKVIDFNILDAKSTLMSFGKYHIDDNTDPDLIITGINDEKLIDECNKKGINHIPSSKFRMHFDEN